MNIHDFNFELFDIKKSYIISTGDKVILEINNSGVFCGAVNGAYRNSDAVFVLCAFGKFVGASAKEKLYKFNVTDISDLKFIE